MLGQRTNEEFETLLARVPHSRNAETGIVVTKYGKYTYNYWRQERDGSWTNYNCRTIYR